jgi:hypothetical protein
MLLLAFVLARRQIELYCAKIEHLKQCQDGIPIVCFEKDGIVFVVIIMIV